MNDWELRLQSALRDAVPDPDVPVGLLRTAATRATAIRRRRVATCGLAGAAAVATAGSVASQGLRRPAVQRTVPLASASASAAASASASSESTLRLTITHEPCRDRTPPPGFACLRRVTTLALPGHAPRASVTEDAYDPDAGEPRAVPAALVVRYVDGGSGTAAAEATGTGEWTFELAVPPGAEIASIRILDAAGQAFVGFES